eukprot:1199368-Lingulodinium_polyedra.AAC.1
MACSSELDIFREYNELAAARGMPGLGNPTEVRDASSLYKVLGAGACARLEAWRSYAEKKSAAGNDWFADLKDWPRGATQRGKCPTPLT